MRKIIGGEKWHGYELEIIHDDIESVFKCVDEDESCAFWG